MKQISSGLENISGSQARVGTEAVFVGWLCETLYDICMLCFKRYGVNLKKRGAYDEEDNDPFGFGLLVYGRLGLLSSGRSGRSGVESH
jgi:hypothetical protein